MLMNSYSRIRHIALYLIQVFQKKGVKEFEKILFESLKMLKSVENEDDVNERILLLCSCILMIAYPEDEKAFMAGQGDIKEELASIGCFDTKLEIVSAWIRKQLCNSNSGGQGECLVELTEHYIKHCTNKELSMLTVDSLSEAMATSKTKLSNCMKEKNKRSPGDLILYEKMNRAFKMLSEDNDFSTIKQVARTLGYQNIDYFSKTFKNQFGFLPSKILFKKN